MGRSRINERDKLVTALKALKILSEVSDEIIQGAQLKNADRVQLIEKGFIRKILKGWYFVADPLARPDDITPFLCKYWQFISVYLITRFGTDYCLSAESSLLLHSQSNVIPYHLAVSHQERQNHKQSLVHGYSITMSPSVISFPPEEQIQVINGLRCMRAEYALVKCTPTTFAKHHDDVMIVLANLKDPGAIAQLAENATGVARVCAAMQQIGRTDISNEIQRSLNQIRIKFPDVDKPFAGCYIHQFGARRASLALAARIEFLWAKHRDAVLSVKPAQPRVRANKEDYQAALENIKISDAYNSLSIEGYLVHTKLLAELIKNDSRDIKNKVAPQIDELAAQGYLSAFKLVSECAIQAYSDETCSRELAATLFREYHQQWFYELFSPAKAAKLIEQRELMGYRSSPVFLRGSKHMPPQHHEIYDGMDALYDCLSTEPDAFVRAVLGHWLFGYIHPYQDGNGRIARFLMNLMLASGGYSWTVIKVENRINYMKSLESASVLGDVRPFAQLLAKAIT